MRGSALTRLRGGGARCWPAAWPWLAGAVAAMVVLGPALGPGSIFLLDAAFVPHYPVPAGVWGLGPAIPRRVPIGLFLAWASVPLGGALAAKLAMGGLLVLAFVGASRLVPTLAWSGRLASGAVYALSPLVLTRLGAGQWNVLAAYAVLPWALGTLLTPGRRPARTLLWALAMGANGSVGGCLAALAVGVGLVSERDAASLRGAALAALAQLPWLVPGLVVLSGGGLHVVGSVAFPTQARGVVGALGLVAGHGFWRTASQVGGEAGPGVALLGALLLALGVFGAPLLPRPWRWRAAALAGVGVAIALASAIPLTRGAYQAFTATVIGAPFREGEREMGLALVWLAPASAAGAARLAGERGRLVPAAVRAGPGLAAVALALPGLWGVGGQLVPVKIPASWSAARLAILRHPGPVLALPFYLHLPLPLVGGREVLNPLPDQLGGDVISSPSLDIGTTGAAAGDVEAADPRVAGLEAVMARARGAEPVSAELARAGVRWVALLHAADWRAYQSLDADPGLVQVVGGAGLQLFEVRSWIGPVHDATGQLVPMSAVVTPLRVLAASGVAIWDAPGAPGWMRGERAAGVTQHGLVRLPAGGGPLWYWPALVVLGADFLTVAAALGAWRSLRTAAPQPPSTPTTQPRDPPGLPPRATPQRRDPCGSRPWLMAWLLRVASIVYDLADVVHLAREPSPIPFMDAVARAMRGCTRWWSGRGSRCQSRAGRLDPPADLTRG